MKQSLSESPPQAYSYEGKEPVIQVENLYKAFGDNVVLNGFNLEVYEGENLVILGRSGSGKTVFIKCLVGLISIDSGKVEVLDRDITHLSQKSWDEVRSDIGFLFQGSALYDSMTVRENLEFPLRRHPEKLEGVSDTLPLVEEALDSVGLLHAINLMPAELSGGMKKRVALARTLMLQPKIILYDEPTGGLDTVTGKEISRLILDIQKRHHTTSIIITHDMVCAQIVANRIVVLIDGKNHAEGDYDTLCHHKDLKVREFFSK